VIVGDEVVQPNVTVPVVPGIAVSITPTGSVPPGATGPKTPPGGGLIVSVNGTLETVSCALPEIPASVAVIVTGPPTPTPVANPVPAPTVATSVFDDFHVDCVVTSFVELSENVPVAVNCCVPFTAIFAVLGVTAIDFSVGPLLTVSCAVPLIVPSVALIVTVPPATPVARPVAAPTAAVSVFEDVHVDCVVTSFVELSENVPVAVNCCVAFTPIVALPGVTAIDTSVGTAGVPVPVSITECGLPCAESVIISDPLNAPTLVGANVTLIVQLVGLAPPGGFNPPDETQLSDSPNPAAATILGIITATLPVFEIVTV
jgi:hypothetical protein